MELYIRSQDKYTLLKYNNKIVIIDGTGMKEALNKSILSELAYIEQMKGFKDGWCISVDDLILGIYNSKERALEVLDEIQHKINMINLGHDFGSPMIDLNNPTYIYEMPKE